MESIFVNFPQTWCNRAVNYSSIFLYGKTVPFTVELSCILGNRIRQKMFQIVIEWTWIQKTFGKMSYLKQLMLFLQHSKSNRQELTNRGIILEKSPPNTILWHLILNLFRKDVLFTQCASLPATAMQKSRKILGAV